MCELDFPCFFYSVSYKKEVTRCKMHTLPAIVTLLLTLVAASPVPRSAYVVKEHHFVPRGWNDVGVPRADHTLDLKIGLRNKNFAVLERHLSEVSDPAHPRYGQHLSKAEVDELVRPDAEARRLVDAWLEERGISKKQRRYSSARDWITINLPIAAVEDLLQTRYALFKHEDGSTLARTTSWSLPEHLHDHIATVQPTTAFSRLRPQLSAAMRSPGVAHVIELTDAFPPNSTAIGVNCNFEGMTPRCLRLLYGTDQYIPRSNHSNIAFTNYLGEVPNRNDTEFFLRQFRRGAVASAYTFAQISIADGPVDDGTGRRGLEGNLDIQTIAGQTYPMNITSFSTGGSPPFVSSLNTPTNTNEPYLAWLDHVLSFDSLPQTISTSYGEDEQTVPPSYARSVCEGFAQLGLRGVSMLFSSGDTGVGRNDTCYSNDGKNTPMFTPAFPASCPYITSVGGTRAYPEVIAYDTRNGYVSGGGFSNYFAQPYYQKATGLVEEYIKSLHGQHDGLYNKSGRAYPDVAAQGYRYLSVYNNTVISLDGTSASAPTVASIVSLLNDALLAKGRPPLGFLNPWLYSARGAGFTDVVNGSATGCGTSGFPAGPGWDVASGFGTPQFPVLMKLLGLDYESD